MGQSSKKKLYRLPAFFLAVVLLFTSIPFTSVNAAGTQEMTAGEIPEDNPGEDDTAGKTEVAGEKTEAETEQGNGEGNGEENVSQSQAQVTKEQVVSQNETPVDSEEPISEEVEESLPDAETASETEEQLESAGDGETITTCQLKVENGEVIDSSSTAKSTVTTEVGTTYTYESGTTIWVETEGEGFFEGWYNDKNECVAQTQYYSFAITENTELTAKWNNNVIKVSEKLNDVTYSFYCEDGSWSLNEENILKSEYGNTVLDLRITLPAEGCMLKFDYCTSSEEGDYLYFAPNDRDRLIISSGKTDYKTYAVRLDSEDAQACEVSFCYSKDESISKYDDCA